MLMNRKEKLYTISSLQGKFQQLTSNPEQQMENRDVLFWRYCDSVRSLRRFNLKRSLLMLFFYFSVLASAQKFEDLVMTPPMGWNTWNTFACDIDETLIRDSADAMIAAGMREAGYVYIVLDDCWLSKERDANGNLVADSKKFPSGMKALGDFLHSKGFKFGIYNCAGTKTCAGYPGGRGHEYQDARIYASWGVDYLKYDWCEHGTANARETYKTMRDALYAAGRPIVFSMCEWGQNKPWTWAADIAHLWRTTGDICNCFDCVKDHGDWKSWGVMQILDMQDGLRTYAGPGHWNDPDMMEVGNGMSEGENRAHFSMWCILAAPLMAGNDVRKMTENTIEILTNQEVIAVDQDPFGIQGFRYSADEGVEVWFKPLSDGDWAMCLLNRSSEAQKIRFEWGSHCVIDSLAKRQIEFNKTTYQVRDLWQKKDLGTTREEFSRTIPSHDVALLRLMPVLKED